MSSFGIGFLVGLALAVAALAVFKWMNPPPPEPVAFKPKPARKLFKGHRP
jgi:hypothetical protein